MKSLPNVTFHRDKTWTASNGVKGFWTRHYNGRVDRGVRLGDWQGCVEGGADSPVFSSKKYLVYWLRRKAGEVGE